LPVVVAVVEMMVEAEALVDLEKTNLQSHHIQHHLEMEQEQLQYQLKVIL
jgi:hypothetical protein